MTSHDRTADWDEDRPPESSASALVQILDRYLADLQAGRAPDRHRLLADHPELADRLESALAGIEFIHRTTAAGEAPARLGEFRILREVGRGGMGVVYEAEQTSLQRRVALKVLRFGIVADEGAMHRFEREAITVARLHHTNIVPIFAVGSEQGVHYYAMQFIEGRNLAEVLAEGRPLPAVDVAAWGLQAAEALEYAHRRGVIHRDVKPSNLLLDAEGVVWLTDFGLAKRADEATLTVAGTLMGTPRYMSPEQAESLRRPVDHRTDVYSLGATLFELATGRPVFEASTPIGVIRHILADDPIPPRQIRPALPRDLETVILTCLAKDPARRYATAQALADDLRAVLDARPIQARRVGPVGKAVRWARRQRRTVGVAAAAAVAAVGLVAGAALGWSLYSKAQLATLTLTTDEPHLAAEVLDADDRVVVPDVSLPTRQPLELLAGAHRVRLSAPGQPTESYDLLLHRGESRSFDVGLGHRELWEPIAADPSRTLHIFHADGGTDLVQLQSQAFRRIDGATGKTLWEFDPYASFRDPRNGATMVPEDASPELDRRLQGFVAIRGSGFLLPGLVEPAPDLDGDGDGDLVWAGRNAPALWAFSGRADEQGRGRELWMYRAGGGGVVVGQPAVADVDRDGTPDLIATFLVNAHGWVEAVSGRSGRSLWRFDIPDASTPPAPGNSTPTTYPAQVGRVSEGRRVVIAQAATLAFLDPATGEPDWRSDLGGIAVRDPILADLDGDGAQDVLLVVAGRQGQRLEAVSPSRRRPLWSRPLRATCQVSTPFDPASVPDWPLVVDLDGDGAAEVVVPVSTATAGHAWAGVEALRGADGRRLWQRRLRTPASPMQIDRFTAGPDLDGDGRRELFVASIAGERGRSYRPDNALYVDALSGRDGRPLWWWRRPTSENNDKVDSLRWWDTGADGWPRLLVTLVTWPDRPDSVFLLSAGTGRLEQEIPDAFDPRPADLDGDGVSDLAFSTTESGNVRMGEHRLHALRGRPPESWARLGHFEPAADLDGDGIADLIEAGDERVTAVSGRDGRVLWDVGGLSRGGTLRGTWSLIPDPAAAVTDGPAPASTADFDGDGMPDLLLGLRGGIGYSSIDPSQNPIPLRAISGRDGRPIWFAESFATPGGSRSVFIRPRGAHPVDLDADGRPEVVALLHIQGPFSPTSDALWLFAFSGRDGRVIWKKPVAEGSTGGTPTELDRFDVGFRVATLDGDAAPDVVLAVPGPTPNGAMDVVLRAYSGRDGQPLWNHPLPPRKPRYGDVGKVLPALAMGDLDGDATADLVFVDYRTVDGPAPAAEPSATGVEPELIGEEPSLPAPDGFHEVVSLDGRSGRPFGKACRFLDTRSPDTSTAFDPVPGPVLADLDGNGHRKIALCTHVPSRNLLWLIDAQGRVRQRREFGTDARMMAGPSVAACDLDGDGDDELVSLVPVDGPTLLVLGGDLEHPVWSRRFSDPERIVALRPSRAGRPGWIAVGGVGNTVVGLDGATGRELWRGQAVEGVPGPTFNGQPVFDTPLLVDDRPDGLPRVLTATGSTTVCLRTLPVDGPEAAIDRAPPVVRPAAADPRRTRPLPWTVLTGEAIAVVLQSSAYALVLLALPALALSRVVRRRPLTVGRLLLVPAILGLALAAALAWAGGGSLPILYLQAATGLPIVVLVVLTALWLFRRRWRRVGLVAILGVVAAAGFGALHLWSDAARKAPWQHYSFEDWYWIAAPAAYLVGLILLAWLVLGPPARLAWRLAGRLVRRPKPS